MSHEAHHIARNTGKATIATIASLVVVFAIAALFGVEQGGHVASVQATSTATTSVTVVNTPPNWIETAREDVASATSSPTNTDYDVVFTAIADDSNGEDYWLLICKSSSTPIATSSPNPPSCGGGGIDQWAVSTSTVSDTRAYAATTTQEAWAQSNDWYAYICDGNAGDPRCTDVMYNGRHESVNPSATSSPFSVNHRPTITLASDDSPTAPGASTTWTVTAGDADDQGGDDTIQLHVCRAQDFSSSTPGCGGGGFWASSTFVTDNPTAEYNVVIPSQDTDVPAYVYIVDEHNHEASVGTHPWHSSSTVLEILNTAPYVSSSSIQMYDVFGTTSSDRLLGLTEPEGETQNFVIEFEVNDDNSCEAFGGGDEITDVDINVFRSSIGGALGAGCDATGEFNANNCYTHTATTSWWTPSCYQVDGSCTGASDPAAMWECTFPLWYIADATDAGSQYAGEDWRGSARATDEALTGNYSTADYSIDNGSFASNVEQFLSFRATGSPIAYGSLEPGDDTVNLNATTSLFATGNTGLDEALSGDAMCPGYPSPCTGNSTSTIFVGYQEYASTSVLYGSGTDLATATAAVRFNLRIPKTKATDTVEYLDTYWGILVPGDITLAGDYYGRNYIDALISPSGEW
jgi:hypothetical protein